MYDYVEVLNVVGTSGRVCGCGSWRNHHHYETGSRREICSVLGCGYFATVGAHVRATNIRSDQQWIVPMCHGCNASPYYMLLKLGVPLVSANTSFMGCYLRYA